ncbi:hypothetical protein ACFYVR_13500 [Rhodococcus sp. NPDC003318]|uniref:hypothetical protein n=1 Tax=Rhodococcus sp. NPDC003318 TaxID=3364503 RepID=UPI00367DE5DC
MTRRSSGGRHEPGPVSLLAAILNDCPNLEHAACRRQHRLFDAALHPEPEADATVAQIAAERLCRGCPHTTRCPDSLAARPHQETA